MAMMIENDLCISILFRRTSILRRAGFSVASEILLGVFLFDLFSLPPHSKHYADDGPLEDQQDGEHEQWISAQLFPQFCQQHCWRVEQIDQQLQ